MSPSIRVREMGTPHLTLLLVISQCADTNKDGTLGDHLLYIPWRYPGYIPGVQTQGPWGTDQGYSPRRHPGYRPGGRNQRKPGHQESKGIRSREDEPELPWIKFCFAWLFERKHTKWTRDVPPTKPFNCLGSRVEWVPIATWRCTQPGHVS